jgi:hypothetical protein
MATIRTVRIAPATKEYLQEEEKKDPLLKKVVTGLTWRLEREPVGYRLPGYNPPTFLLKFPTDFPSREFSEWSMKITARNFSSY